MAIRIVLGHERPYVLSIEVGSCRVSRVVGVDLRRFSGYQSQAQGHEMFVLDPILPRFISACQTSRSDADQSEAFESELEGHFERWC
jgi:hypothetical protein